MNIPKLLAVNARKFPAGEALITADCRLSWSELHKCPLFQVDLRLDAYQCPSPRHLQLSY